MTPEELLDKIKAVKTSYGDAEDHHGQVDEAVYDYVAAQVPRLEEVIEQSRERNGIRAWWYA